MFNLPVVNKMYVLGEDLPCRLTKYNSTTRKYEPVGDIPKGSNFKVTRVHLSTHSDYCTLNFARKFNKGTPLKAPIRINVICSKMSTLLCSEFVEPKKENVNVVNN